MFRASREDGLHQAAPTATGAYLPCTSCTADAAITRGVSSVAMRLQQRLSARGEPVPGIAMIEQGLSDRSNYLSRSIVVQVSDSSAEHSATWTVDIAKHPELVTLRSTWATATFGLDRDLFAEYLNAGIFGDTGRSVSVIVKETAIDVHDVMRAQNVDVARDGFEYDVEDLADAVERALRNGAESVDFHATFKPGTVQYAVDGDLRELSLLSTGKSEFSNSPEGRIWNVHKSINERTNNIVIPQGGKFSYVDALDVPVTTGKGWREEMGLFGGGAALTPGAGICQAATTVYRAALLAGLPIHYRRFHSMFVDHYEQFGIGLDATVFPGVHDMAFRNDTSDVILVQAYTVGDEVFVNFYGIPDERTVTLDGPYFNDTPNRPKRIRPLDWDEIGWTRTVTYADGRSDTKPIVSTYVKGFAKSIKNKYRGTLGVKLLEIRDVNEIVAAASTSY